MKYKTILLLVTSLTVSQSSAAVITTLNFDDGIWTKANTESGSAVNSSSASANIITVSKASGTGGTQIDVTLNSSISTLGFENITIGFTGLAMGDLEWNGLSGAVASTDGFFITGDGIAVNGSGVDGTTAETEFNSGTTFPTANFNTGFSFDASVNNSAINNLTFTLRVNAAAESLSLSNIQILGDAVPEPSSTLLLGCGSLALLARRNRS